MNNHRRTDANARGGNNRRDAKPALGSDCGSWESWVEWETGRAEMTR
jgi:hypothetical protein